MANDRASPLSPPATHAQASRQRKDAISAAIMPEGRLVRFVLSPDGVVTPDVARKLPGRGVWVEATRTAVEAAIKRGAFARSLKAKATVPPDLADQVEARLAERVLAGLGLARRSGDLTSGFEKVASAITSRRAAWLLEASDGAADGRRKMLQVLRRTDAPPPVFAAFTGGEMSLATGGENVIHGAFLAGRAAERWTEEVRRLEGFRPLLPESWREGP